MSEPYTICEGCGSTTGEVDILDMDPDEEVPITYFEECPRCEELRCPKIIRTHGRCTQPKSHTGKCVRVSVKL